MARLNLIILLSVILSSCKKDEPTGVMISIENNTSFTLHSVKLVYDTTNYNFGTILSGRATGYVFFKSIPDGPAATADSANKKILAGHFIPPNSYPTPTLANGKYTLEIFPDSTLFYLYGAKFIKN
jgi:hypothetical protein